MNERKKPSEIWELVARTDAGTVREIRALYAHGPLGECQDCTHWRDIGNGEGICYLGKPAYTLFSDQCHRYEQNKPIERCDE